MAKELLKKIVLERRKTQSLMILKVCHFIVYKIVLYNYPNQYVSTIYLY